MLLIKLFPFTINLMLDQADSTGNTLDPNPPKGGSGSSPPWSANTKLVVALTLVAIMGGLVLSFRNIVGPLLLSFVLAYLLYPFADRLRKALHISWKIAVNLIFLLALIIIIGLLLWGGITLVEQIQSLLSFLQKWIVTIPEQLDQLAEFEYRFGPFEISLGNLEIDALFGNLLNTINPMFSQVGVIVGTAASSIAVMLGWTLFVLLISYFILSETQGIPERLIYIRIPRYQHDIDRFGVELARIWNAFLRGQLTIILITIVTYSIFLGIFGMRFFYGLALLAGLARFVPYVGPTVAWTAYGLVAYFQGYNPFGLTPLAFAVVVVVISLVLDFILDNYAVPRLMGTALKIHPAAVLVAALVGASLLGVIGIILAAPVLATARLFAGYSLRKLSDEDPWAGQKAEQQEIPLVDRIQLVSSNVAKRVRQFKESRKIENKTEKVER
jgi:predicted PurR-regulated permease PerM